MTYPSSECLVPKVKFSVDPDYIYEEDYFSDPVDIFEDPEWEACIEKAQRNVKLFDVIYGDEQAVEEENLEIIISWQTYLLDFT